MVQQSTKVSWVQQLLGVPGCEVFCEVGSDYILDNFNLVGIKEGSGIEDYDTALSIITEISAVEALARNNVDRMKSLLLDSVRLYGLVHARFLLTPAGQYLMAKKLKKKEFGICPRILCDGAPVLPVGLSTTVSGPVHSMCIRCRDLYRRKEGKGGIPLDGAYFGPTYANLLLLNPKEFGLSKKNLGGPGNVKAFIPQMFGFKIGKNKVV